MVEINNIVRIDVPETTLTPAAVEALILAHRGLGVEAANPNKERKESQDDLKLFLTWVEANGIAADEAAIAIVRVEEHPEILRVGSKYNDYLFMVVDTHDSEGKTYEYIKSITTWQPGEEVIRPEEYLMIAPKMYLDEPRFLHFLLKAGFSQTDHQWVQNIVKEIVDNYPIQHGADRPQLYTSRLFNIVRIDTPLKSHFPSTTGTLYAEIMVADKGSWSRAGRLRIMTGWKDVDHTKWSERIVVIEQPKGDEPEQHAMSAKAGVYQYINIGENEGDSTIHEAEPELRAALKHHLTSSAAEDLNKFYQMLTSPSNPAAIPGKLGYRLLRLHGPNLVGNSNPLGQIRLELFTGDRFVGALNLQTIFMKPFTELSLMDGLVRIDYIEAVDGVQLDADSAAQMHRFDHRWASPGGWAGLGGQRWGGGPTLGSGPAFAQQHAWGPAMQMPFQEEAKLSTFKLESYNRMLTSLVENMRLAQPFVHDVMGRMFVMREQLNPQVHGTVMYQFEFNSTHGLLMRMMSQSGVVHLQQVVPMQVMSGQQTAWR